MGPLKAYYIIPFSFIQLGIFYNKTLKIKKRSFAIPEVKGCNLHLNKAFHLTDPFPQQDL